MSASLPRFLLRALVLTLAVGALAWALVGAIVGPEARMVVPWAAAIALVGAVIGRLTGLLVPRGRVESAAQASLVGMGTRMIATLALAWVATQAGVAPLHAFALVLGALYLALLVLEVALAVAEVRDASGGPPSHPGSSSRGGADA